MTNLALVSNPESFVFFANDDVKTTSLIVAEKFSKRHDNIVAKIKSLDCSENFTALNFKESEYKDSSGKSNTMYEMTKDGLIFLVMGFTGKLAAQIKEDYINAFNFMHAKLFPKRNELVELPTKTLTPAMLRHINKRVAWLVKNQVGSSYSALGGAILDKFNVNKRENIPLEKYREVCELLNCEPDAKALQGELVEPLKIEYQPPEGMMLVAVEDFEKLKKSTQQIFPENYHQFIDVVNSMESANYRIFKKDVLVALHEMLSKMI